MKSVYRKWKNDNGEQNEPSVPTLTNLIKAELGKSPEDDKDLKKLKTFWGFFENFIERSKSGVRLNKGELISKATIVNYQNLYNGLKKYEKVIKKKFDFDSFDIHFYNQYYTYLIEQKFATNTIAKRVGNLKLMLREAYEDGYSRNTIFNHSKFRATQETVETTYLNTDEIAEIYNLDLNSNPRLERVRDAFVIGCLTGLRFSDVSKLTMDNVKGNIIEIVQTKTGDPVAIPLRPQVLAILAKYNNQFPKVISNQKFNQYLREFCKECLMLKKEITMVEVRGGKEIKHTKPKYEFISTHTARRSFATNEFLAKDIKTYQIMALTGHKTEKSFYRYIRLTREENAIWWSLFLLKGFSFFATYRIYSAVKKRWTEHQP